MIALKGYTDSLMSWFTENIMDYKNFTCHATEIGKIQSSKNTTIYNIQSIRAVNN